jgi:hypothetical protein
MFTIPQEIPSHQHFYRWQSVPFPVMGGWVLFYPHLYQIETLQYNVAFFEFVSQGADSFQRCSPPEIGEQPQPVSWKKFRAKPLWTKDKRVTNSKKMQLSWTTWANMNAWTSIDVLEISDWSHWWSSQEQLPSFKALILNSWQTCYSAIVCYSTVFL